MKDDYRYTGTLFKRSPLVSPEGQGFAAKVRAVVADHARSLQGVLERAKREGGRYTQGLAGKRRTTLPGGVLVETWINPFGLTPTIMARVLYPPSLGKPPDFIYYMDSGFVLPETAGGQIWQTPSTAILYEAYNDSNLALFGPKEGLDGGVTPPSFKLEDPVTGVYADKLVELINQEAGNYTGKLRWLISGQYGLKLDGDWWPEHDIFVVDAPATPRTSGEGVFTDVDGRYWYVKIDSADNVLSGTVTLLDVPEPSGSIPGVIATDVQRMRETHLLAMAKKTEIEASITVAGDLLEDGLPLAYGWHFSEDGHTAAIVIHDIAYRFGTGADLWFILTPTTRKYTAELVHDNDEWIFSLTLESTTVWDMPLNLALWSPMYHPTTKARTHIVRYSSNQLLFDDISVPLYCFYDKSGDLQDCLFEWQRTDIPDENGSCFPYLFNGLAMNMSDIKPGYNSDEYSITVGPDTMAIVYDGAINGTWDTALTYSTSSGSYTHTHPCSVPVSRVNTGYSPSATCLVTAELEPAWYWGNDVDPSGWNACQVTEINTFTDVTSHHAYYTTYTNSGAASAMSLIFPFATADAVVVIGKENRGAAKKKYQNVRESNIPSGSNPGSGAISWQVTITVGGCPNPYWTCSLAGGSSPTLKRAYAFPGTVTLLETTSEYVLTTKRALFTRHGIVETEDDIATNDFILTKGDWGDWLAEPYEYPASPSAAIFAIVAETDKFAYWSDGVDTHYNNFPEDATITVGWV